MDPRQEWINKQADKWLKAIRENPRAFCYICQGFRIQLFRIKKTKEGTMYVCKEHRHLVPKIID